jgi:D-beta-D-heptose 7-phosphate kinase / D-beta-D-heptose 1-phosphate adenosyltransferase
LIDNFSNARVLVIGDVMLDRYWWGSVSRISPEAPVPVINLERTTSKPGGAANVALNAASLGAYVTLLSAIGDDAEGAELAASLVERGISTDSLVRIQGRRTSVKTRIIAHSQQVTRVDSEQVDQLSIESSEQLVLNVEESLQSVSCVIVSDYAKGTLPETVLRAVIDRANELEKYVLVDPKGKYYQKYSGATVLTPNRREAAEACKLEESDPDVVTKAGGTLLGECGLEHVLITEGEHGMTLFGNREEPYHLDASVHQVYDVTGAGDSVIACLGVALAAGLTMRKACELANAAGGISVQHVGTHAVTLDELRAELERSAK